MSDYPTLHKMGVTSVDQIERYTLRHQGNADVLKIYYKRPKGSLLSRSKKFSFLRGRSSLPLEVQHSKAFDQLDKISPQLLRALEELKRLDARRRESDPVDPKEKFRTDLNHLEKVMNEKIADIRQQLEDLK